MRTQKETDLQDKDAEIERLTNICEYARNELRDTEAEIDNLIRLLHREKVRAEKLEAAFVKLEERLKYIDPVALDIARAALKEESDEYST